jgi:glycoside/pentoside/hexuronide:cation symporter, GPH family
MNFKNRIFFLSGQVGIMLLMRFFFGWILSFAALGSDGKALFSAAALGAVLLIFRVLDGVSDPLVGGLSDRWVASGKERRKLLLYTFALAPLGFVLCFLPSPEMSVTLRWLLMVLGLLLFFAGYTVYAIPYWSLIDDYSNGDVALRQKLSSLLGLGLMLATAFGFVVSPWMLGRFGYLGSAGAMALLSISLLVLPYFCTLKESLSESKGDVSCQQLEKVSLKQLVASAKSVLGNRQFISFIMIFSGSQMSLTVMTAAAPFITTVLLGLSEKEVAWLMAPLMFTALLSFSFIPLLTAKYGWQALVRMAALFLAGVYASTLVGFFLMPQGKLLYLMMLLFAAAGPGVAVLLALEGEAITDSAQLNSDSATSTYFGVYNLIIKLANGTALFVSGIWIDCSKAGWGKAGVLALPASAALFLVLGLMSFSFLRGTGAFTDHSPTDSLENSN